MVLSSEFSRGRKVERILAFDSQHTDETSTTHGRTLAISRYRGDQAGGFLVRIASVHPKASARSRTARAYRKP